MITPKILKGFRDYLPESMIQKKEIIKKLELIFESFGFVPIDTPALEYTEILLGKGGGDTDKQIYRFNDHGNRDVSLRFDLTVPLARFVSQYYNELVFPFKAYHIAPVWRGENTQKGRFREFFQCDFDILGSNSIESDLEILLVICYGLQELNAGEFKININNRKILNGLLTKMKINKKSTEILRVIDKMYKIGSENVLKELIEIIGIDKTKAEKIINLINGENKINNENEIFKLIENFKSEIGVDQETGINEIEYIFNSLKKLDLLKYFSFNPAITRGLDYYTGLVFESFILDRMEFGSICSGGRYDNLTGLFSKNIITGIGACFGLDRILSLLEDKKVLKNSSSKTQILIFNLESNLIIEYQKLAKIFRENGINCEIYLDQKKLQNQFKFAEKKTIQFALFAGQDEINKNKYNLKNLQTREENNSISMDDIIDIIKKNKK